MGRPPTYLPGETGDRRGRTGTGGPHYVGWPPPTTYPVRPATGRPQPADLPGGAIPRPSPPDPTAPSTPSVASYLSPPRRSR
jgi:hypothetical protein